MHFLSLCAIVKNEGLYLHEWVRHHLLVGVEHFHVYDNESAVPARKILREFVDSGQATVIDFPGQARQLAAYHHCLETYGPRSSWLGFIDCDEFLFPRQHADFREFLIDFDAFAGVAVNCVIFGSSGHLTRPKGLQTQCYQERFPLEHGENCLIKSLVQPKRTAAPAGVHHFHYTAGNYCVNERQEPVFGPFSPVAADLARINHYFYRSQQDFCEKLERGHADFPKGVMKYGLEQFYDQSRRARTLDQELAARFPLPPGAGPARPAPARSSRKTLVAKIDAALRAGHAARAVALAKAFVMQAPQSEESWLLLGVSLHQAGCPSKALEALYASVKRLETIEAFFRIFQIRLDQGNQPEARRIASYLRYRLSHTDLTRQNAAYAQLADSIAAYLATD